MANKNEKETMPTNLEGPEARWNGVESRPRECRAEPSPSMVSSLLFHVCFCETDMFDLA